MATNYPNGLDNLVNPASTDAPDAPSHSQQHANANDAIEALQAKVGINNSSVTTSLEYRVRQLETNPLSGVLPVLSSDPVNPVNGTIYLNSTSGRVRVFFNEWMNLSTLEELISHRHTYTGSVVFPSADLTIDGGMPSTTIFDSIYDGGEPGTTVFASVVDSGTIA